MRVLFLFDGFRDVTLSLLDVALRFLQFAFGLDQLHLGRLQSILAMKVLITLVLMSGPLDDIFHCEAFLKPLLTVGHEYGTTGSHVRHRTVNMSTGVLLVNQQEEPAAWKFWKTWDAA